VVSNSREDPGIDPRIPSWLPNWRDTAEYPQPHSPEWSWSNRWAWEFLRRNQEYGDNWTRASNDQERNEIAVKYGLVSAKPPGSKNPPLFVRDLPGPPYVICPKELDYYEEKISVDQNTVYIAIVLDETLSTQFRRAKHLINNLTRLSRKRQRRPEQWLKYLRLLDADTSGATKAEINSVLYPELSNKAREQNFDKRLFDDREAARQLCWSGYRRIV
jgi:hypothetical protein